MVEALDGELSQAIWRGNQMASAVQHTHSTGYASLDAELPGNGWPKSTLIELLLQQHGIGEIRLLRPVLAALAKTKRIALLSPPFMPQIAAWSAANIDPDNLLLLKSTRTADTLWAAEQILLNGSCGAAILWQQDVKGDALRRLQLAAQASETMFWLVRPAKAQDNPSPAPLRVVLSAATDGVNVHIAKRRGPVHDGQVFVRLVNTAEESGAAEKAEVLPAAAVAAPAQPRRLLRAV
ncbi:translesion DNA synthesis-associated protein ImuA [Noviherbaspirillum pedocola]|uniref:Translesion DNA synthesis-associated protein ImuA n=1 Tax=Noviherbaspirillum pedocola TaxID=2801341 RepID=A0A934SSR4_9BURK|nr:translesion DNA synthesis-associated protein ImuA [Noviherbaspirillum pedocola]MBK4735915.1 translesion DNA synthesis-associated protein ImuA [Noviherbaspirillum pedocola]